LRKLEHQTEFDYVEKEYSPDKVLSLFKSFGEEAFEALLFLRFVEEVELHVWEPRALAPRRVLRVAIENFNQVRSARSRLTDMADRDNKFLSTVSQEMKCPAFYAYNVVKTTQAFAYEGVNYFDDQSEIRHYGVTSILAGGRAMELALRELMKERGMRLIPWAGVAALFPQDQPIALTGMYFHQQFTIDIIFLT